MLPRQPLSTCYGYDRGAPVDRIYIETFLNQHQQQIRGDVAEVKDDTYTKAYSGTRVRSTTIVDIDPANPRMTLQADIGQRGTLPPSTFDCIILTQVLQLVAHPAAAILNCRDALRPAGTLLVTVPCIGRVSPTNPMLDRWRFTPAGARLLFDGWPGPVRVTAHGNLRVALAALVGEAAEELTQADLDHHDPAFPVVSCIAAQR